MPRPRCKNERCDRAAQAEGWCWIHSRRKPINPRNKRRNAQKFIRNYGAEHPEHGDTRADRIRALPCIVATAMARRHGWPVSECAWLRECHPKIDAAHAVARGMGGAKGDCRDLWPGCRTHHTEAGEHGTSQRAAFVEKYGADPVEFAAEYDAILTAEGYDV